MRVRCKWFLIGVLLCTAVAFLAACGAVESPELTAAQQGGASEALDFSNSAQNAVAYLDDEYRILDGFRTHLPVVVIREDETMDFFLDEGEYSQARLAAGSDLHAQCAAHWCADATESTPRRDKTDYDLSVHGDCLSELQERLWGVPVHDDWQLLGNMYDKSLLRNYLALSLANDMGIATSLVQFCEVIREADGQFIYQGVYLLTAPPVTDSLEFQRGNYRDPDSTLLNTYATQKSILVESVYVPSNRALGERARRLLCNTISSAEQSIFSGDYNEFSQYTRYLNTRQMYDYFILYELFGNYANAHLPRYSYSPKANTFSAVALTDFELSVDNEQNDPLDLYSIHMMEMPYYTALVKNTNFIKGIIDRYRVLYQGMLGGDNLDNRIDEAAALLGEAQMRDWSRWQAVYAGAQMYSLASVDPNPAGEALPLADRNTYDYEQEINKLKYSLREHGKYMFGGISLLYDQEDMMGDDAPYVRNTWMFLVSLIIVVASVRIVRRRTR